MFSRLLLYARTARYLRPRQWLYFPLRTMQRRGGAATLRETAILDRQRLGSLRGAAKFLRPGSDAEALRRADEIVAHRFAFLNHSEDLPKIDWKKQYVSPLWNYHLHYFDYAGDLTQAYLDARDPRFLTCLESLITDWMQAASDGKGDGWDPYPTSVRIVNWIFCLLLLEDVLGDKFKLLLSQSLYRQLLHLEGRLEWHLLTNHLQKNLLALLLGGLIFQSRKAERWRRNAARELWAQVEEQILADGGHAERSPMYHAIALRDLLEAVHLARAAGEPVPAKTITSIRQMASALGAFIRDDDTLHLFNDAAQNIASPHTRLRYLANSVVGAQIEPAQREWALVSSGYYGYRDSGHGDSLIIDCGNPAPRHQPGHAHCGLLSYELDLGGMPVVVDSGVHGYEGDRFREYGRSTRAHNTVSVDGKDQSEMWGTFRVGRRASVITARSRIEKDAYIFEGAYHPYHAPRVVHHRTLRRTVTQLEVTDVVYGKGRRIDSFLHLHPDFSVDIGASTVVARGSGLLLEIAPFGVEAISLHKAELDPIQGWYCPEFGKAIPQYVLTMRVNENRGAPFGYRIIVASRPA